MKFVRRLDGEAKADIESALTTAEGEIDGEDIGREAARRAIATYLTPGDPQPAIEGTADKAA